MIFVDTGGWYASIVPTDPNHVLAMGWLKQNRDPLVTTDYVADETLTLLRARGHNQRALALGKELFEGTRAALHFLTPDELHSAWQVFRDFHDKEWSFTDCTSKVVMEKLDLTTAFAFDQHFRQFGAVTVVP
jgi:predicted nucleic acid-binding protein